MARLEINLSVTGLSQSTKGFTNFSESIQRNLTLQNKLSDQLKKVRSSLKSGDGDYNKLRLQQESIRQSVNGLNRELRNQVASTNSANGSLTQMRARLNQLRQVYDNLSGAQRNSSSTTRTLVAEINRLNSTISVAEQRTGRFQRSVGNYGSALSALSPQLGLITGQMGAFVAAGLLVRDVTRTIGQFDSSLRNVEKTTGLTSTEVSQLGDEFVKLSQRLQVVSANSLSEYATVAGQLGVKGTKDILAFSEALAKLETATNISGEQGGAEIARTLTLIEGGVQNVAKFGDEIVNLGNNFAATEKEILENAEAIAQNTTIYGFGRQEVLAYAAASRALGIQQEVVGSTFQKTLGTFERAIRTGKGLDEILKVVGGSAEQLGKRFNEDAAGVLQDYIKGLNGIAKAGGSVMEQMERNGIVDIRQRRVIGTLATGYDTLARAIDTSRNSAGSLEQEFGVQSEKLIKQTERVGIAWDNFVLSIEKGDGALGKFAGTMAGFLADTIDQANKLVNSSGWKSLISTFNAFTNVPAFLGETVGGTIGNKIGQSLFGSERGTGTQGINELFAGNQAYNFFERTAEKSDELQTSQAELAEQIIRNKSYWESQVKAIKSVIEEMDVATKGTAEWTAAQKQLAEAQRNLDEYSKKALGGSTARTTGKSQADLIREANEALSKGQVNALNGIDAELLKIDNKYDSILKKINRVTDATVRGQLAATANVNKELEISNARLDAWLKTYKKSGFGTTLPTPTGQLAPVPTDLPFAERTRERLARGGQAQFGDKDLEKRLGRVVERGLRRGIDDIFQDIDDLGSNFYEVFSNTFGKLATTITNTFGQVLSTQLGDLLSKRINSGDFSIGGLGSNASKSLVAGGGLLGGILSAQGQQRANTGLSVAGGALSGAAAGTALLPGIGTAVGAVVGAISGIFSSSGAKKAEKQRQEQLAEQRKQTALAERQAALAFQSSIVGQMTNQGIVSGFERDSFGNIVFKIEGKDLVATLDRQNNSR